MINIPNDLSYDKNGLIPTVVQDYFSNQVLMVAYMNEESLKISVEEGYTCFYSRSRQELWRKGETSGNRQKIVSLTTDCDKDTLLIKVIKDGPACHLGSESCFTNHIIKGDDFSVNNLYQLILQRKADQDQESYTSYLFREGLDKILKKVGEESTEVVIGAKNQDIKETVYEIADLYYHVLVLMAQLDITPDEILSELKSRHVVDEKEKQKTSKAK